MYCRRLSFRALVSGVLLSLFSMAAQQGHADMPVTYKDGDQALFLISVPDFWQVRAGGARTLTPPGSDEARQVARVIGLNPVSEDGVWVGFVSPPGVRSFTDGVEYLRGVGPSLVKDPELSEQRDQRIGGRRAVTYSGTGRRNGKTVNFTAVLIDMPGNRVAVSIVVFEAGANPDILTDVNAIFASFRAK